METLFIGKNLLFLHEVESTNTYAMNLLRNVNAIEGTVVYTDNQTSGKGQRGSSWNSEIAQNITASVVLRPHFLNTDKTFYLSKISALAIYDVLAEILPLGQYDIKIKWPNDILVDNRKIAGILIENNFTNTNIQYSVIGVGLNVNQINFSEFERAGVSMKLLTSINYNKTELLENICSKLEKWYLRLKEQKEAQIDEAYLKLMFGINEFAHFADNNGSHFSGRIIGVSQKGKLEVELETKIVKEFDIKEIKFLT
jgi:BirA family transcriptional regulator, biotin operon repressor / biotin---[acetyl-CoA-carboxylase] ligase